MNLHLWGIAVKSFTTEKVSWFSIIYLPNSITHVTSILTFFEPSNVSIFENGILLPKLFWPTVRKNCSTDREKLLKFEAEGREFAKFLRSLEQFIQAVKCQNNFL